MGNKVVGERIEYRRKQLGLTLDDIAQEIGVAKSTIQRYERGTIGTIKLPMIEAIANIMGVNPSWICGKTDVMELVDQSEKGKRSIRIPVLGNVAAGIPIEAITDILDYEEISEDLARTGDFFGLRIKGSSMEPRMQEGDIVIVRQQQTANTGDTVVVLVNGDSATVKKIKYGLDGITLIPTNPSYDPMFYSAKEVENLPVRVIGRVVELRAKY